MISMYHKALFVHIPKTGGQSIEEAFLADIDASLNWDNHRRLLLCLPRMSAPEQWPGPDRLAHLKAYEYIELNYLPRDYFDRLFKFSIVRNPFTKIESHYFYNFSASHDFESFVLQVLPEAVQSHPYFAPQADYLTTPDGSRLIDHIYQLENMAPAWTEIKAHTGVNTALSMRNISRARVPVQWTPAMIDIVCKYYKRDFDLLGYPETVC